MQKNQDGSIREFSKFIPKSTTDITQDFVNNLCQVMKILLEIYIRTKEFNEFKNQDSELKDHTLIN